MSKTIKDSLIDFLINTVRKSKPLGSKQLYSDDQCLELALQVIEANFFICLNKMAKGEEWKL